MRTALGILLTTVGLAAAGLVSPAAQAAATTRTSESASSPSAFWNCPPAGRVLGYSDALDKLVRGEVTLGGLSNLAYDPHTHSYAATVDNNGTDPARIWFFRDLAHPVVTRDPLVLRRPDGTPYTGVDADDEGLAIQRDGTFLVSSETEPTIRVFGRDGVQRSELRVPARFQVAPAGQATANATLEGLSLTPRGDRLVAAMEGPLSGDGGVDSTYRRMLVFDRHHAPRHGHRQHRGNHRRDGYRLDKQVGYRVDQGFRVAEVQAYGRDSLLVLEAEFDPATGNAIRLYAVTGVDRARDVSDVTDLSAAPRRDVLRKRLVADVTACPSLGAPSKETQTNPLLDNYEGMAVSPVRRGHGGRGVVGRPHGRGGARHGHPGHGHHGHGPERARVTLISDDNFSANQTTRVLRLAARLP